MTATRRRQRAFILTIVGLGIALLGAEGRAQRTPSVAPASAGTPQIIVERDVPVVMRDGMTLYADIYRPDGPGPFPALLMRTPYDKEGEGQSARLAMTEAGVTRGYVVVVQDTRGQYGSEGFFVPYGTKKPSASKVCNLFQICSIYIYSVNLQVTWLHKAFT